MKIKKSILTKINTTENRLKIALAVKQSERSIEMAIQKNAENGPLTKAVVLRAIREITGLSDDEILLTSKVTQ
jgi:hypothetical protein